MMDKLKRHLFLLSLVGGVVIVSALVIVLVLVFYTGSASATEKLITKIRSDADGLRTPITPKVNSQLADFVNERAKGDQTVLAKIAEMGRQRDPLVKGLFPQGSDRNLRFKFRELYAPALKLLAVQLEASGAPSEKADAAAAPKAATPAKPVLMYIHPEETFFAPTWVRASSGEPPNIKDCREAQENLWLMQDLVSLLAGLEKDVVKDRPHTLANSPVKELIEIRIGADTAMLTGVTSAPVSGRFMLPPESKAGAARAPTLTGRWSRPDEHNDKGVITKYGEYKVLPWRLVAIVESRYAPALVGVLKGTESFLTVTGELEKPLAEKGTLHDWAAKDRSVYGTQGVVRIEIIGESLVFQLPDGRVTTAAVSEKPAP